MAFFFSVSVLWCWSQRERWSQNEDSSVFPPLKRRRLTRKKIVLMPIGLVWHKGNCNITGQETIYMYHFYMYGN